MSVRIDYDLCDNTGCCESVCPEDVFERENNRTRVVNPEVCSNCWTCVDNCAAGAIEVDA